MWRGGRQTASLRPHSRDLSTSVAGTEQPRQRAEAEAEAEAALCASGTQQLPPNGAGGIPMRRQMVRAPRDVPLAEHLSGSWRVLNRSAVEARGFDTGA
jgi:hypothetical protein